MYGQRKFFREKICYAEINHKFATAENKKLKTEYSTLKGVSVSVQSQLSIGHWNYELDLRQNVLDSVTSFKMASIKIGRLQRSSKQRLM